MTTLATDLTAARAGDEAAFDAARRAPPRRPARPLLPDARLGAGRRGRAAGRAAARLARARQLRGPQLAALLALPHRHERLPAALERRRRRLPRRPGRRAAPPREVDRRLEPFPDVGSARRAAARPRRATSSARASSSPSSPRSSTFPPRQRAVLLLRDVLGFAPGRDRDVARRLPRRGLQRAPARARRRSRRSCPSAASRRRCGRSATSGCASWPSATWRVGGRRTSRRSCALLTDDAAFAMPPLPQWFRGRDAIGAFLPRWADLAGGRAGGCCRRTLTARSRSPTRRATASRRTRSSASTRAADGRIAFDHGRSRFGLPDVIAPSRWIRPGRRSAHHRNSRMTTRATPGSSRSRPSRRSWRRSTRSSSPPR